MPRKEGLQPKDLLNLVYPEGSIIPNIHLKIDEVLGKEAENAFATFVAHCNPESRFFDPERAKEGISKFTKIAGFSPMDVIEMIQGMDQDWGINTHYWPQD